MHVEMTATLAQRFLREAQERGFRLYTGVPCSYLGALFDELPKVASVTYVPAANEGDAVAIAAGVELGGSHAVVMMQNSGLGNAVNPLSSLTQIAGLPVLLLIGWRGEPDAPLDEPQHRLMGALTPSLLDSLGIAWAVLPSDPDELATELRRAAAHMRNTRRAFSFLVRKGPLASLKEQTPTPQTGLYSRREYLRLLQDEPFANDVLVATTGYTGRELEALSDRPNQFYLVGAMGCASSVGLGLALAQPNKRVIVLDGDGAAVMRLGAFVTIAAQRPQNLLHIVFDNGAYESTGGQLRANPELDFATLAASCGYPRTVAIRSPNDFAALLLETRADINKELTFVHIRTPLAVGQRLPRPALTPTGVTNRLADWLARP